MFVDVPGRVPLEPPRDKLTREDLVPATGTRRDERIVMSEGADGSSDGGFTASKSTAGPFSPQLNSTLSTAFGCSMADISVVRGVDSELASIGAAGTTSGRTIGLSSAIRDDMSDPFSMEVIGHEVAHALAGGGSGTSLIDEPGDPGESAAYASGRAFAHFAENPSMSAPSLAPAYGGHAAVHRFEIEHKKGAHLHVHDPMHETMTARSLAMAGLIDETGPNAYESRAAWDYTRGAKWNDDPEGKLFSDRTTPSVGAEWGARFEAGGFVAGKLGGKYGVGHPLLQRSHYGDLQFLHGMANDGEKPEETKQKMMMWAQFTTQVASGQIKGDAKLSEIMGKDPNFRKLIAQDPNLAKMNVNSFFGVDPKDEQGAQDGPLGSGIQKRALGSLMHMIQDSYAGGHAEREDLGDGRRGAIKNFHAYGHQDHGKHAAADHGNTERGEDLQTRLANTAGVNDAIHEGAVVAAMFKEGMAPEAILDYLSNNTFRVADGAAPAAPGQGYEKGKTTRAAGSQPSKPNAHSTANGHFAETQNFPAETIEGKRVKEMNMRGETIRARKK